MLKGQGLYDERHHRDGGAARLVKIISIFLRLIFDGKVKPPDSFCMY